MSDVKAPSASTKLKVCPRGHPYRLYPNGGSGGPYWQCRICATIAQKARRHRVSPPRTALQRFFEKVVFSSGGCWLWTGAKNKPLEQIDQAYGSFRVDGKTVLPHRWLYETCVGPIPDGLQLDHLCRTRLCTNFDHVEPVTHRENCLRGFGASGINARKTHCPQGHPYDATNTIRYKTRRICRTCYNRLQLRRYHSHKSLSNV